jgi:hypothetical protein
MVWNVLGYNIGGKFDFFDFQHFISRLKEVVRENRLYQDPDIKYLPREIYLEGVLRVLFEMYYPSQENIGGWERGVQHTFSQLNSIISVYANMSKSKESRFMLFLFNFWRDILQ